MKISVPYGRSSISLTFPDDVQVDTIEPPAIQPAPNPLEVARAALDDPLGGVSLSAFAGVKSVGIAVNDKTRPVPLSTSCRLCWSNWNHWVSLRRQSRCMLR